MPEPNIRVLIIDASAQVRHDLRALLDLERSIHLVGEANSLSTGITATLQLKPDIVLLDIHLPDGDGFKACQVLLAKAPNTKIILLAAVAEAEHVDEALKAGAHGYLLKESNGSSLLKALHEVAAGNAILDSSIRAQLLAARPQLRRMPPPAHFT